MRARCATATRRLEIDLQARLQVDDDAGIAPRLHMQATGSWRGQPLQAQLVGSASPMPGRDARTPLSLTLDARVGRASLQFEGQAADAAQPADLSGHFRLSGPSLAAVGDPLGVTLPTTAAFVASGLIAKQGDVWSVRVDEATVGASRLNALLRYDAALSVPLLAGRLGGSRLMLADLGPVVGAAAPTRTKGKVLPDRPFDLASLRAMDANVLIDIDHLDLDTRLLEPLQPLQGHLQLRGGVLSLSELQARTGEGRVSGSVALDGRAATAEWSARLRWDDIRLERWIRQVRAADDATLHIGPLERTVPAAGPGHFHGADPGQPERPGAQQPAQAAACRTWWSKLPGWTWPKPWACCSRVMRACR